MEPPGKWVNPKPSNRKNQKKGAKIPLSEFPNLGQKSVSEKQKQTAVEVLQKEPIYLKKDVTEHILDISAADNQLGLTPWSIKERYLGHQNSLLPDGKFRYIYEAILTETGSVQISHNLHKASVKNSPITHSKCHVVRVLNQQEWGFDLNKSRSLKLKEGIGYNYWDYIQAWSVTFYYQNPIRKHSWLISINPKVLQAGFPTWFARWWEKFSPNLDILPEQLKNLYLSWYKIHPKFKGRKTSEIPKGKDTLWYFSEFQITWIWRWDLEVQVDDMDIQVLRRTFYYKWWDGFETFKAVERMTAAISHYTKQEDQKSTAPVFSTDNWFQTLCDQTKQQFPECSMEECRIKVLEQLRQQFLSSQATTSSQLQLPAACLAGESQNPDEDMQSIGGSDSTMQDFTSEDLLDEIIDIETEKLQKKGKKKI